MPLQSGVWAINSNGTLGQLTITNVDPAGNMSGTLQVGALTGSIVGFWDEISARLTFVRGANIAYSGFLLQQDRFRMPGIQGSVVSTLTGYFVAFPTAGGTADRPVFGWYAQIGQA
jgi:hypothetical protein